MRESLGEAGQGLARLFIFVYGLWKIACNGYSAVHYPRCCLIYYLLLLSLMSRVAVVQCFASLAGVLVYMPMYLRFSFVCSI
jgi:hypothetical protein